MRRLLVAVLAMMSDVCADALGEDVGGGVEVLVWASRTQTALREQTHRVDEHVATSYALEKQTCRSVQHRWRHAFIAEEQRAAICGREVRAPVQFISGCSSKGNACPASSASSSRYPLPARAIKGDASAPAAAGPCGQGEARVLR